MSSHDIDYVVYVGPGLTRGRILSSRVISMWSNDIKCKYMFMIPLKNLARKWLRIVVMSVLTHWPNVSFAQTHELGSQVCLSIDQLRTTFRKITICVILTFIKKMHLKMSSTKGWTFFRTSVYHVGKISITFATPKSQPVAVLPALED